MSRDIVVRFGKRLKHLRNAKRLTQIELAEKVGIEQSYLSLLENGKQEACLRVIDALATGLGVSLSTLFRSI
jgi:transcriptional regulator with XRE-family HTH domain